jgi:hypothetical protein
MAPFGQGKGGWLVTWCSVAIRTVQQQHSARDIPATTVNKSPAPTPPPDQVATRYGKDARAVAGSRGRQDFPLTRPEKWSIRDTSRNTQQKMRCRLNVELMRQVQRG